MSSRLTPMEIEDQRFSRKMRGFDPEEVRLYLKSVAEEVERLNLENGRMLEETGRLGRDLAEHRTREKTLQETLVTAQRMSEQVKEKARAEAEMVLREARLRSDEMLKQARDELAQLDADISRSKFERQSFEQRLRGLIEQHLTLLEMRGQASVELDNLRVLPRRLGSETG